MSGHATPNPCTYLPITLFNRVGYDADKTRHNFNNTLMFFSIEMKRKYGMERLTEQTNNCPYYIKYP